jgi:hypothetical protein
MVNEINNRYRLKGKVYCSPTLSLLKLSELVEALVRDINGAEVMICVCVKPRHKKTHYVVVLSCALQDESDKVYRNKVGQIIQQFCKLLGAYPGIGSSQPM